MIPKQNYIKEHKLKYLRFSLHNNDTKAKLNKLEYYERTGFSLHNNDTKAK